MIKTISGIQKNEENQTDYDNDNDQNNDKVKQ